MLASDLHARDDWFPAAAVTRLVDQIHGCRPDVIVMPGDFVGDDPRAIDWAAPLLCRRDVPVLATLGNHDHHAGAARVRTGLLDAGVQLLDNRAIRVGDVWFGGIDSCFGGAPDPAALEESLAQQGREPHEPVVVLGHEPFLATLHSHIVHLAGHTHHGQIRLPGLRPPYLPQHSQPYVRGLFDEEGPRWIYTSAGVGFSGVPLRLFCPSEIVLVEI